MLEEKQKIEEFGSTLNSYETAQATGSLTTAFIIVEKILKKLEKNKQLKEELKNKIASNDKLDVQIKMGDRVLYQNSTKDRQQINGLTPNTIKQIDSLISLPASDKKHSILDRDVSIKVDGEEVFRYKNGIIELNQINPDGISKNQSQNTTLLENNSSPNLAEVRNNPDRYIGNSYSVDPERLNNIEAKIDNIAKTLKNQSNRLPASQTQAKSFLQSLSEIIKKPFANLKQAKETQKSIKADLQSLAMRQTTHDLMNKTAVRVGEKDVFEGNTYRFIREGNNISVTAKDGRGEIFSSKDGVTTNRMNDSDLKNIRQLDDRMTEIKEQKYYQSQQLQLEGDDDRSRSRKISHHAR